MYNSMTFPATVDEFMEEYKVVDSEHVYSNGMELVPIFRMKQWFEHEANHDAKLGKMVDDLRTDFMNHVYWLLSEDTDNNRANEIIEAADEYVEDAVKEALEGKDTNVPTNSALDHIHNVVRDDAYRRGYEQGKADANHPEIPDSWIPFTADTMPKNGTLIIPLNESDFKSVKRIILDNKPWCRTFYEDVPGEAHWIKSYTPDDGEIYECDNCGVTWQFNDGGPEENEAFYCPKCGFKMVPKEGEANGQE